MPGRTGKSLVNPQTMLKKFRGGGGGRVKKLGTLFYILSPKSKLSSQLVRTLKD